MEEMSFYLPSLTELKAIPKPKGAKNNWGYCGIAAMSAATGISPLVIYESIPDWPGYTPSRMIVSTLKNFGIECIRKLIPKKEQKQWPKLKVEYPSFIALGRIYFGEGKFAESHWVCFIWEIIGRFWSIDTYLFLHGPIYPFLYDNGLMEIPQFGPHWLPTIKLSFWGGDTKLKSLYFVRKII